MARRAGSLLVGPRALEDDVERLAVVHVEAEARWRGDAVAFGANVTLTGFGARGFAAASFFNDCASDVTAAPFQDSSVSVCAKSGRASLMKSLGTQAAADFKGNDGPATTPDACSNVNTDGSSTESGRALSPSMPSFFREARGTCLKDQAASTSVGFDKKTSNSDVLEARTTPKRAPPVAPPK